MCKCFLKSRRERRFTEAAERPKPKASLPPPKPAEVDEAKVAADVAALPKGVFDGVPNAAMKSLLRDAVQAMRQGIAVGRATGMLPRRALSIVVVIDEELDGRAQVFAGDRTVPTDRPTS